jgi:peroxiredoxin
MVAKLCLLTCALTVAQPADRSELPCQPRLVRGQELVYSGSFTEEEQTPGVHFQRSFRLELNVFILDAGPHKAQAAFLTALTLKTSRPLERGPTAPRSVRLELAAVDERGHVRGRPGASLAVPVEGPPTVECGAFVEVPAARLGANNVWEVAEDGRPPRTWRVTGTEVVAGTTCVKLLGQQQSDDWNSPRADRTAWRRRDTVWLSPQLGVAYRVERVFERRDPARETPTHRTVLRYELDSRLTYPGELFDRRRQEIAQADKFLEEAIPLLRQPTPARQQLDAVLKRITNHLETQPPTPYRKAIVHLQGRLEAARRGELPPELPPAQETPAARVAAIGRPAPDFVATNLLSQKSMRLHHQLGRPVLLCFYNPRTDPGTEVLRFAQSLSERQRGAITVLAMAVTDDSEFVRKQHTELRLSFPVLDGNGLHVTYDVQATPRLVVLDPEGIVRGLYTGWGPHSAREVAEELQRWVAK